MCGTGISGNVAWAMVDRGRAASTTSEGMLRRFPAATSRRQNVQTREAASKALLEVGLTAHEQAWPGTLSGGEAQRVALARALVREPELLLLDEPFAALDSLTRLQMQDLVGDLFVRHQPAVLLVTHDVDEAIRLADRVLILRAGKFVVDLRIDSVHPRDRNDPYFLEHRRMLLAELGVGLQA